VLVDELEKRLAQSVERAGLNFTVEVLDISEVVLLKVSNIADYAEAEDFIIRRLSDGVEILSYMCPAEGVCFYAVGAVQILASTNGGGNVDWDMIRDEMELIDYEGTALCRKCRAQYDEVLELFNQ
jgi:hypothetical protein